MSSLFAAGSRPSNAGIDTMWGRLAVLVSLLVVAAVAHLPTTRSLLSEWNDTVAHTYTHGFLVLGVSLWLVFRSREALSSQPMRPLYAALLPLVVFGFASVVVQRAGIEIGHQLLLPLLAWLSILAALGWGIARLCVFPMGYLYFAVPIWTHINDQLQQLTVAAVQVLLRASGVPAYFAGNSVEIPSGLFEIEGGCSGLHFLIVALALAALFGELQGDRLGVRFRHLVFAGILAVVANWIRVYTIILAGYLTNMQHYLVRVDHYYFGWLVFAVAMAVFLATSRPRATEEHGGTAVGSNPVDGSPKALSTGVLVAIVVLAFPPSMAGAFSAGKVASVSLPAPLPGIDGWSGPVPAESEWRPVFSGADRETSVSYAADDRKVELYVAYYYSQQQGKELIGYLNSFVNPMREVAFDRLERQGTSLNQHLAVDGQGQQWLVWSYYTVGRHAFTSGVASELWYGLTSLTGPIESRAVAMRMKCATDCAVARDSLGKVLEQTSLYPGARKKELSR